MVPSSRFTRLRGSIGMARSSGVSRCDTASHYECNSRGALAKSRRCHSGAQRVKDGERVLDRKPTELSKACGLGELTRLRLAHRRADTLAILGERLRHAIEGTHGVEKFPYEVDVLVDVRRAIHLQHDVGAVGGERAADRLQQAQGL